MNLKQKVLLSQLWNIAENLYALASMSELLEYKEDLLYLWERIMEMRQKVEEEQEDMT